MNLSCPAQVNDLDTRVRLRVVDDQLLGINDKLGEFEFSVSHLMADKVMIHKQTHSPRGRRLKHLPGAAAGCVQINQ